MMMPVMSYVLSNPSPRRLLRRCAPRNELSWLSLRAQRSNLPAAASASSLSLPGEDGAAVDDGLLSAALHRAAVERRVLRFRAEPVGIDAPQQVRIEHYQIGGRARGQPADLEPENARRVDGQPAQHLDQLEMTVVVELERQRQQGFQPDDAVGGRAERQPLRILVPRRVIAGDRIDRAVAQSGDDGAPVGLAAERG